MKLKQNNLLQIYLGLLTKNGKKIQCESWYFQVLRILRLRGIKHPSMFILRVANILRPPLGLKSKQVASTKVRIPAPLPLRQQHLRALRWLVEGAKKRDSLGRIRPQNLADELVFTSRGEYTHSRRQLQEFLRTVLDSRAFMKYLR